MLQLLSGLEFLLQLRRNFNRHDLSSIPIKPDTGGNNTTRGDQHIIRLVFFEEVVEAAQRSPTNFLDREPNLYSVFEADRLEKIAGRLNPRPTY